MADVISKQNLAQAQQTGFNPGISADIPVAPQRGSVFWNEILPVTAQLASKYAQQEHDNAFVQGQADQLSGMITEQSWLTQRSYDQGKAYQTYTQDLADFPVNLRDHARASIDAGENLQQYTERVKPLMAGLNQRIDQLGLTGTAKETAQKQMLTTLASAQDTYQKELEKETFRRVDESNARISASAVSAIVESGAGADKVIANLDAAYDQTYEVSRYQYPKQAADMASKNVMGALQVGLARLNMADPNDVDKLRNYEQYLQSAQAGKLQPEIRARGLEAVNAKFLEVRQVQQVYDDEKIRELETRVAAGQPTDPKYIDSLQDSALADMRAGRKTPAQANSYIEKLQTIKLKAVKDMGEESFLLNAQYSDLLANKKTAQDQTAATLTNVTKQYGADYTRASISAINYGVAQRNMGTIKAGAELATSQFIPALTQSGAELQKANDGQQGAAFAGFVGRYQDAGVRNAPGMQAALLEAIPQADRPAFELLMRKLPPGAGIDLRSAAPQLNVIKQQLKEFEARGGAQGITVKSADMKSKFWFGGSAATAGAEIGYQPSDTILELNAQKATSVLRTEGVDMAAKGYLVHDGTSGMQALVRENRVLRTPNGPIFINPSWVKAVGVMEGVASDNQQLSDVIQAKRTEYVKLMGGRVKSDDVYAEVRGTSLILRGYDKNGSPMQEQAIDAYKIKDQLNAEINKAQKAGMPKTIAMARTKNQDFEITADWGVPFKSNELGAAVGQHLAAMEGYVSKPTATDTRYTSDKVIGIGINLNKNPKWAAEAEAAGSDPKKMAALTGRFVKEHYKDWSQWLDTAGLPGADSVMGKRYRSAYIGLADAAWHGGSGGATQYASAIKLAQTDKAAALEKLKSTAFYKQSGPDRKKYLEQGITSVGWG